VRSETNAFSFTCVYGLLLNEQGGYSTCSAEWRSFVVNNSRFYYTYKYM